MKIYEINVAKDRTRICGKLIPKGAIYGQDTKGYFVCLDYKILSMKEDLPVLKIYRFDASYNCRIKTEASSTTDAILDFFMDNEAACTISSRDMYLMKGWNPKGHGFRIEEIHIVSRDNFRWHDKYMPIGTIYGYDGNDYFSCLINESMHEIKFAKNGYPIIKIARPRKDGTYCVRWDYKMEANPVTDAIFRYYLSNKERCKVDNEQCYREMRERKKVRSNWNISKECNANMFILPNQINPRKKVTIAITVNKNRTLDDIAKSQKGKQVIASN